jgi:hypothetical protein
VYQASIAYPFVYSNLGTFARSRGTVLSPSPQTSQEVPIVRLDGFHHSTARAWWATTHNFEAERRMEPKPTFLEQSALFGPSNSTPDYIGT